MKAFIAVAFCGLSLTTAIAQQPAYTPKHFVRVFNEKEFETTKQIRDGLLKTYIISPITIFDVDDKATTHVRFTERAMVLIESEVKNGKREGITRHYVVDSADHSKRYLIYEQTYVNDRLNGLWKLYNLRGTPVQTENYRNDTLHGVSRQYWIDGKTIMAENDFIDGANHFIAREFFDNGKVKTETTIRNGEPNGEAKAYYESGILKDKCTLKNGKREGLRVYYYPDGKPWIENTYKNDIPWTIIANYDSKGKKRDGGTLKDGNGTMIYYDDDTTVREILRFVNGVQQ